MNRERQRIMLVTGFPLITARYFVLHSAKKDNNYVAMLVPHKFERQAKQFVEKNGLKTNVRVISGDIAVMHLGFSSEEYRFLLKNVTDVFHLASIYYPNTPEEMIKRVNIQGTKNIIQFIKDAGGGIPLNYLSTCMVFENHRGLVLEEPVRSPRYKSFLYKSRYIAESIIMSESNLLWRIFRAPLIAGDSVTGESEKLDGFYALIYLLLITDMKFPVPVPEGGNAPLNIVPVDYLVKVLYHISTNRGSVNKIFHIVPPHPISIGKALELISKETGKGLRIIYSGADLIKPLLRIGILKKLFPSYIPLIDILNQFIVFSHTNTDEYLKDSDIKAPRFEEYLRPMIDFVKSRISAQKTESEEGREQDPYGG